jgi:antitoxin HigA-1
MENQISILKGIHPGFVLERELKKRHLKKGEFAHSLQEYPQTLVSIMKGKRKMNTALSLKIESKLGIDEGYFMTLQVYFDIEAEKQKQVANKPDLTKIRAALFWDTKIENINWQKQKKAIIQRVFERGNELEKQEIERFYGKEVVLETMRLYEKALL